MLVETMRLLNLDALAFYSHRGFGIEVLHQPKCAVWWPLHSHCQILHNRQMRPDSCESGALYHVHNAGEFASRPIDSSESQNGNDMSEWSSFRQASRIRYRTKYTFSHVHSWNLNLSRWSAPLFVNRNYGSVLAYGIIDPPARLQKTESGMEPSSIVRAQSHRSPCNHSGVNIMHLDAVLDLLPTSVFATMQGEQIGSGCVAQSAAMVQSA